MFAFNYINLSLTNLQFDSMKYNLVKNLVKILIKNLVKNWNNNSYNLKLKKYKQEIFT